MSIDRKIQDKYLFKNNQLRVNLMEDSIADTEISAITDVIKSGRYTQGKLVNQFEEEFAAYHGAKYGVMVNSGSSANLLAANLLKQSYNLQDGDEVLVPAVTWPTTVYPLLQHNLKPVFCDVDESFNISAKSIKKMSGEKTKAAFLVHLLGQPVSSEVYDACKENNLLVLEDTCESTGAQKNGLKIGNEGLASTFSFYFGHHMTTIEGGMILVNNQKDADTLKSLRSHGWVRNSLRENSYKESHGDTSFLFDMVGYNLRSTDMNAAIGIAQLKKLDDSIVVRRKNHQIFLDEYSNSFLSEESSVQKVSLHETSSFSLALLFDSTDVRNYVLNNLKNYGVEARPIVAGNLLNQPVFSSMELKTDVCSFADKIDSKGVYLPNNQFIDRKKIEYMMFSLESCVSDYYNI